jgi:DNA-binding transcriptional MerR regulator
VGERSYLAIGDVLALLREEFPDVTISKIRFLESRGLLDPERTPSGYRKFYEPDVDRLRWILRQQREHFLPLKVIKGRLENGMTDPEAPTPHLFEMGDPPPQAAQPVLVGALSEVEVSHEQAQAALSALAQLAAVGAAAEHRPARAATVATSPEAGPPAGRAAGAGPMGTAPRASTEIRRPARGDSPPDHEEAAGVSTGQSRRRRPHPAPVEADVAPSESSAEAGKSAPVADAGGREPAPAGEESEEATPARRVSTRPTAGLPGAGLSGASLTLVELANASGLEVSGVEELESFGLIAGRTVAGVHCYGEEAVFVAKLAARFAPYGIEARHLKIFKHAADRQTGLYGQVVTPLLRQRNPEARARAIEDLAELAELGEALMRCFSQATLRELTGG